MAKHHRFGQETGGYLSAQGLASSKAALARNTVTSSSSLPTICSPMGSPSEDKPQGTEAAGLPVKLKVAVNGMKSQSMKPRPRPLPRFPTGGAVTAVVGQSNRS